MNTRIYRFAAMLSGVLLCTPVMALDQCTLEIVGHFSRAAPKGLAKFAVTAELTGSVESETGHWLKNLKPVHQKTGPSTKALSSIHYFFELTEKRFCEERIQIRLEGTCISKGITKDGKRMGANFPLPAVWVPAFNKPSRGRKFEVNLCQ